MKAGDAKRIAERWLVEEWLPAIDASGRRAGYAGAYVMGSLGAKSDDDNFNEAASDIDIAIVVDTDVLPPDPERYPHGKFGTYGGCVVQAIFVPKRALDDEERLLAMLGLGCNLRRAHILGDPDGIVEGAQRIVRERWALPEVLERRVERASTFLEKSMARLAAAETPLQRLQRLVGVAMEIGGLVAIANAVTPTHRRSLALAKPFVVDAGRSDLYERLLATIGAGVADETVVAAACADAVEAAIIEVRARSAEPDSAGLDEVIPGLVAAGIADLVDDGFVREAMLPALQNVGLSADAGAGAEPGDRARLDALVDAALARAGVTPRNWTDRVESVERLVGDVTAFLRA